MIKDIFLKKQLYPDTENIKTKSENENYVDNFEKQYNMFKFFYRNNWDSILVKRKFKKNVHKKQKIVKI